MTTGLSVKTQARWRWISNKHGQTSSRNRNFKAKDHRVYDIEVYISYTYIMIMWDKNRPIKI